MLKKGFILMVMMGMVLAAALPSSSQQKKLKVFISADFEGVCGVINWEETSRTGMDYGIFRKQMSLEVAAAIRGAQAAGATEIVVRDSHGSARNILPELLPKGVKLIRDWSGGPLGMMEGIDKSFDAVIFVGYHARAGTADAVLEHTYSGAIFDLKLNDKLMPEAGLNAAIAGYYGVPVVMIAGDAAVARQEKELLGDVEVAVVKEGIGNAAKMLHPEDACSLIEKMATKALQRLGDFKPYRFTPPYTLEVTFKEEGMAYRASLFPGARRLDVRTVSYTHNDLIEVLKFWTLGR